ncbi:Major egg antigen [Clonorchis sinensis]|uniref:Major egg antigen n=1 Tax=Clonorchis sinensis TaxID=79923 RepID=A0A3R7FWY8_CLOSI|nr:Major egg antigen [Clonorchis sinensis]
MTGQERQIVVHRDNRSLEQQHRDRISSLERRQATRNSTDIVPRTGGDLFPRGWFQELDRWMAETQRSWYDDIRRMRENMFSLLPLDEFDLQPPFWPARPTDRVSSVIEQMERQMEAMRRNMQQMMSREMGSMLPNIRFHDGPLDFLKDAYQVGEDGKLHFIVRFDLQGFRPEDIRVTSTPNCLTVKAQKSTKTNNSSEERQYYRLIYLPDKVEDDKFKCHLSNDGILTLDAPVKETDYDRLAFDQRNRLAIKPRPESPTSRSTVRFSEGSPMIQFTGKNGLTVLDDSKTGKKIHVEVPLEPEFGLDNVRVYVESKNLVVHGYKNIPNDKGRHEEDYRKEFTRTYKLPSSIDTLSIRTRIELNTLLIEAPLL